MQWDVCISTVFDPTVSIYHRVIIANQACGDIRQQPDFRPLTTKYGAYNAGLLPRSLEKIDGTIFACVKYFQTYFVIFIFICFT